MEAKRWWERLRAPAWGATISLLTGCESLGPNWLPPAPRQTEDRAVAAPESQAAGGPAAAAHDPLSSDRWVLAVGGRPGAAPSAYRFRHPGLDPLVAQQALSQEHLKERLRAAEPVTAANAAILLARTAPGTAGEAVRQRLAAAIRAPALRLQLRAAAAESLRSRDAQSLALARELTDQFGSFSLGNRGGYLPEIHAGLVASLGAQVSPAEEPRLGQALASPAAEVRLAALEVWRVAAGVPLPEAAIELRLDADPRVRVAALRAMGARRDPELFRYVEPSLRDHDLNVRGAAIAALGEIGGDQARAALAALRQQRSELTRAAAVGALAALGADREALEAVADKSSRVRQAVADSLAAAPRAARQIERQTKALAQDLVRDTSAVVQQRAVTAVAEWPLPEAGPVLLAALAEGAYVTRQAAAEQLARRWPPAARFPVDGSADERQQAVEALRRKWTAEFGTLGEAVATSLVQRAAAASGAAPAQLAQVGALLRAWEDPQLAAAARRQVLAQLVSLGPAALAALEQLAQEQALPAAIYTDVLPGLSPVFGELERLTSRDVHVRRAAAEALLAESASGPLSELALRRLADVVAREHDALVWQKLLQATAQDARAAAVQLAYTAIGHASSEVRRRAAEYLAAHPAAGHAAVLLPALEDPHRGVVIAAVRAIGAIGAAEHQQPLVNLLASPDQWVRLEAAISLARNRVEQGQAALERLAYATEQDLRRRVATALGELNDPIYLPTLMLLLNDRPDVQRAALASLAVVAGRDVGRANADGTPTPAEQVVRWQQWYRDEYAATPASATEPAAPQR